MARKKKKSSNRWMYILGLLVVAMVVFAVIGKQKGWIGQEEGTKVTTESAEKRTIVELVTASGKIYPEVEVKLSSEVSGELIKLVIEEGDSVKRGQLIAQVNSDNFVSFVERADATVNASKANMENAKARIQQLEVRRNQLKQELERNQKLYDQDVISALDLENSQNALLSVDSEIAAARQTVESSKYNVKSTEASLKEAKENLNRTNVYAPISGIVSLLNVEEGEQVLGSGQFQGTELGRIANFQDMEARVEVSENDILKVKIGDTSVVEIDAYLDKKFMGVVTKISSATSSSMSLDQVANFTVKIKLLKESYQDILDKVGDGRIPFRPGMSATADIQTLKKRDIITIPIQAVTTREIPDSLKNTQDDEDIEEVVFVLNAGKVSKVNVDIGIQDDTYIEITEGLSGGEEIVTAPYRTISKKLKDDMKVKKVDKEDLFNKDKD